MLDLGFRSILLVRKLVIRLIGIRKGNWLLQLLLVSILLKRGRKLLVFTLIVCGRMLRLRLPLKRIKLLILRFTTMVVRRNISGLVRFRFRPVLLTKLTVVVLMLLLVKIWMTSLRLLMILRSIRVRIRSSRNLSKLLVVKRLRFRLV